MSCQLVRTKTGALLIDAPGLRELGLWQPAGFDNSYQDILALSEDCRFRDCLDDREPGCQVKLALDQGRLSTERFLGYLELLREQKTQSGRVKRTKSTRRRPPSP
jgi:ribosome biogenesis GTPase